MQPIENAINGLDVFSVCYYKAKTAPVPWIRRHCRGEDAKMGERTRSFKIVRASQEQVDRHLNDKRGIA